ncbi:glycoside hydrolase family 36 protein [Streptomyces sp. NPDC001315]|uniref:glycoside hydrolase family 36 protein n=1 Tax=Streptomyces sp. NPDC001315 TaxID=3364562 RepID=UPI0036C651B7
MTTSAVTTAERPPAATTPLLDDVALAVLADGRPVRHQVRQQPDGVLALSVTAPAGTALEIRLTVPLRDAVGYWHPTCGWARTLPPDWSAPVTTSLVWGAPAGCLYASDGATLLAFAAQDPVTPVRLVHGVSEAGKRFVVHLELTAPTGPYTLFFAPRAPSPATALRRLRARLTATAAQPPLGLPPAGRGPAYSTWYALGQDVTADAVAHEARLAARLGCELLILDDGWQRGGRSRGYAWAGDWQVDPEKFPDLAAHVAEVRGLGMAYIAWVAPLLAGPDSPLWRELAPLAVLPSPTAPGAHVLDPRDPRVRAHVVATCARLVGDHGLDGLKLDFLDEAMVYAADGRGDVSAAMDLLLGEIRDALTPLCRATPLIELRQPYLGHGMAAYGNLLRATDCPADAVANRVRTVDAGLLCSGGAVHSDMLMWDPDHTPQAALRQLLAVLHATPQLSCKLGELRETHYKALEFWLAQWARLRPLLVEGELEPGRPDELYPLVRAAKAQREAIVVHAERTVPLDLTRRRTVDIVNATAADALVLDLADGGRYDVRCTAYDVTGEAVGEQVLDIAGGGPVKLSVPPSGLLSLRVRRP